MNPGLLNYIVRRNRANGTDTGSYGEDLGPVGLAICHGALGLSILGVLGLAVYALIMR